MNGKDNIMDNPVRFGQFKVILKKEYSRFRDGNSFQARKDLDRIIGDVTGLRECFKRKLIENTENGSINRINNNLKSFYDEFFSSFDEESHMFDWLLGNSHDYFFARKVHQLSHSYGEFKKHIENKEEIPNQIKDYYLFLLFLDYFETFPIFLKPMIREIWENKAGHFWKGFYRTRDSYKIFYTIVPDLIVDYEKIRMLHSRLRNKIAHSTILFQPDRLEYNKDGQLENGLSLEEAKTYIDSFQKLVIIFATEFDLRILRLGLQGDDNYYDNWFRYFEIYNEDWQRIGPEIGD